MPVRLLRGYAAGLLLVLLISTPGCSGLKAGANGTLPSSAYFAVELKDLNALHSLARKQEAVLKGCTKLSCEDARYTLGLVALFENRADALNIFQQLHTTTPDGLFATSSARWIQLLQDSVPSACGQAHCLPSSDKRSFMAWWIGTNLRSVDEQPTKNGGLQS